MFLDTNFIFAIFGLANSRLSDVSHELAEFVKKHNLPLHLVYHEETLVEMQAMIDSAKRRITRRPSPELSQEIVNRGVFGGIFLRYHQNNAKTPISPEVFFSKYENIPALLTPYGFQRFQDPISPSETVMERGEMVARYEKFLALYDKTKAYETRDHDVAVWLAVQRDKEKGCYAKRYFSLGIGRFIFNDRLFLPTLREAGA